MKKFFTIFLTVMLPIFTLAAKSDAYGRWITEKSETDNRVIVDIYEKNGKVYGKVHQLTNRYDSTGALRKDVNNPDSSKRSRTIEGIDFVSDFTYNEKNNKYEKGKIYDPSSGKTYDCYMELNSDGTLKVRGHIPGIKFLGKTQTWRRYK